MSLITHGLRSASNKGTVKDAGTKVKALVHYSSTSQWAQSKRSNSVQDLDPSNPRPPLSNELASKALAESLPIAINETKNEIESIGLMSSPP